MSAQLYLYAVSGSIPASRSMLWTTTAGLKTTSPTPTHLHRAHSSPNSGPFAIDTWKAVDVTFLGAWRRPCQPRPPPCSTPPAWSLAATRVRTCPMLVVTTVKNIAPGQGLAPVQPAQASTLDSDGDGLSDADEQQNGADINNPDSDGDGLPDLWEVEVGLDPWCLHRGQWRRRRPRRRWDSQPRGVRPSDRSRRAPTPPPSPTNASSSPSSTANVTQQVEPCPRAGHGSISCIFLW